MNKEWSELNKEMQSKLKKEETYKSGIDTLFELRNTLMDEIAVYKEICSRADFDAMPFINASGYHSKTIAYSLWHIFRIEDIVAHTLIANDEQVFFSGGFDKSIGSPIITTGNELKREQIAEFSEKLDIDELYRYIVEVKTGTEKLLSALPYSELKRKMTEEDKERVMSLNVVSTDENAIWLIDYWCGKDVRGLIQMPFSRHWIMHVEAANKIKEKLVKSTC